MGEYPQESKQRLVQICLQQKGHGKQSPSAQWLRGTAVLNEFQAQTSLHFLALGALVASGEVLFIYLLKFALQHKPQ